MAPSGPTRPNAFAAVLVEFAARRLPFSGRDRYREEFRAELCVVPAPRQISMSLSYLVSARSLRRVLRENAASWPAYLGPRPLDGYLSTVWTCRIGLHSYIRVIEDQYSKASLKECRHCGRVAQRYEVGDNRPMYTTGNGGDVGGFGGFGGGGGDS